jgi:hypothetical protein
MAYPRSKHLSSRFNARLRGKSSNNTQWLLAGLAVGIAATAYSASRPTPSSVVLALDLSRPPSELNKLSILSPVGKPNHYDTLRVLQYAAEDKSVRGIIANVGPGGEWNMAQAQEIRQASQLNTHSTAVVQQNKSVQCQAM